MKLNAVTLVLFIACLSAGFYLAQNRPLENDELYTQIGGVQSMSYTAILRGKIAEGNNAPLFYISQKSLFNLIGFHLDEHWQAEEDICAPGAQVIMRILPVICMSASLCLLFYFFARRHHVWAGALALALALTSPMIWLYWAQARPYGLWILLSTCQILLLISISSREYSSPPPLPGKATFSKYLCAVVHLLLCLTTSFGAAQAVIGAMIMGRQHRRWALASAMLGIFYWMRAPHYPFRVAHPAFSLIDNNFSTDRMILAIACAVLIMIPHSARAAKHLAPGVAPLKFSCAMLMCALTVIAYYVRMNVGGTVGFELSARYFIFLTPLSVAVFLLLWIKAWHSPSAGLWTRINLAQAMAGALVLGAMRTLIVLQRIFL